MLLGLPKDLYETYERMLGKILEHDRPYALTLLRWLAYAQSPVSLDELAEASIIDPTDDPNAHGSVDFEDRGCWEDILEILAGFVILERVDRDDMDNDATNFQATDSNRSNIGRTKSCRVGKHARFKLAHFSVKEYLESQRLLASEAKGFHFDPAKEHSYLMQSCIVYLAHYGDSPEKTSTAQDLAAFPLLEYAAKNWYRHASLQRSSCGTRELSLLTSKSRKRDWLLVHDPDRSCNSPFQVVQGVLGGALYYASLLGLETAVQHLLSEGADVNARGGQRESALQAASEEGHEGVVQRLIDAGADVDIQGGFFGCPLQAASYGNYENVVQMLINAGADVNAQGGYCGTPLQAASFEGRRKIVQILVDMGADINAQAGEYGNALQAASFGGHKDIVQILLGEGADVNAEGGECGTALQAASYGRHMEVVQILMEAGAGLEVEEGAYDIALAMSSDDEGQSSSSELF
jgi:ankyrin repeat protein